MDECVGWYIKIWQGKSGVMHIEMSEDDDTGKTVVSVRQPMDGPLTLNRVADELIAIAPWVRLQDNTKEFK